MRVLKKVEKYIMARVNVEDSIWKDKRFLSLCMKLQSIDAALGAVVRSWILAQKWYLKTLNRMVPLSDWKKQDLPKELFDCSLALIVDEKWVRVAGADEQFGWLLKCVQAGSIGGKIRAKNQKMQVEEMTDENSKGTLANPKGTLGDPKGTQASYSSSYSSSFSLKEKRESEDQNGTTKPEQTPNESRTETPPVRAKAKKNVGIRTEYPTEFEEVWEQYQRKGDKKSAYDVWKSLSLQPEERELLKAAIKAYQVINPDSTYRLHFDRFLKTDWREYIKQKNSARAEETARQVEQTRRELDAAAAASYDPSYDDDEQDREPRTVSAEEAKKAIDKIMNFGGFGLREMPKPKYQDDH